MRKHRTVKLGVCPIGKFVFSHDDAKVQKKLLFNKLDELKVDYIDIDERNRRWFGKRPFSC